MARLLAGLLAAMLAMAACATAGAQCAPLLGALIADTPAEARYVARYNDLVARDLYLKREDMAADWRALLADLGRDPAVSIALVARTENRLAAALGQGDDIKEALAAARHALQLADGHGLAGTPLHAEIVTQLSIAETEAGKVPDAIVHADAAMAEAKAAFGARSWPLARAAMFANSAYFAAGRYAEAEPLAALAEDLAMACLSPEDPRIVSRIASHATVLDMVGRVDDALAANERAASWALTHGLEHDTAMLRALDGTGFVLRKAGRYREAEGVLRHAVDLAARYNPGQWALRALLLGKLADVLEIEGHHREAEALWLQASDYDHKVNELSNPLIGSGEIRRAASAAQARDDLPLALARRERAVALIAKNAPADHPELARARIEYATTLSLVGRDGEARALAEPAMAVLRAGLQPGNILRMATEVAYAQIVAGPDGAAAAWPIAAPVVQRMEATMLDAATSRGDLVRFAPLFSEGFATTARLALATHRDAEAFHQLQLTNFSDIAIVNAEIATRAAAGSPVAQTAIAQLQRQVLERQQLGRDHVRAVSGNDAAKLADIEAATRAVAAGIAASTRELDRVYPAFRRIGRPAPVTLDAFRARLRADDVLVAPFSVAGETLTIAVTRDGLSWASTPTSRAKVSALVDRIRASIDASRSGGRARFDTGAARRLYLAVMPAALASVLRSHRHILYYASGALARIPPALLIERAASRGSAPAWLIRSHSISVLPTLDPPRRRESPGRGFMGVGAPLLRGPPPRLYERGATASLTDFGTIAVTLPPLPHAARELRAMAATFPAGGRRLLLAGDATERAMKTLPLDRFGVLAIATHGLVRDSLPGLTEPALVLTPPKTPDAIDDGLLTASEIANLTLRAEWVILSACDTAGGSAPGDATYSGLARAFIEAGAQALLVSHWAVRDDAAERLTVATVRATRRGTDRATALQRAMIALMRDRSVPGSANPAVWAPFVLVE